jgi:uncharacterized protein
MPSTKLYLDANILFSLGYFSEGAIPELVDEAIAKHYQLVTSAYAVDEARGNIARRYPERLARLESYLKMLSLVPEPTEEPLKEAVGYGLPSKDAPILAAAIGASCDYLVTGDKRHFGHLYGRVVRGVRVLAPRDMLELLLKDDP